MSSLQRITNGQLITVFGQATETGTPNKAQALLGSVTENEQVRVAQAESSERIANIVYQLEMLGISKENIQTDTYRVSPEYDFIDGKQVFRGYRVTHLLKVDIDSIDLVGTAIDVAVEAGANSIVSISFLLSDPSTLYEQALSNALVNAKRKAEVMATTMGATLQPLPSRVVEVVESPVQPYRSPAVLAAYSEGTPIQTGDLSIHANVEVDYHFRS
ncbi:SIMPL domain-containing protein [Halalkalibacter sp. APA_J-10(15)]|uniref:SIMPL domain-containing protein n=1 Tax=Halalkalibacter sp. APA_J-10(15) TaxID=2933805 RepID=UPI001FF49A02|nr:SIMPL domain-containing protein [Halalkalibacter sp. APA_J-10(15)]MCK0472219.1 SIMPL domain-containing protein [Halalkalibacter sp. APA_J-10(15)]